MRHRPQGVMRPVPFLPVPVLHCRFCTDTNLELDSAWARQPEGFGAPRRSSLLRCFKV